MNKYDIVGHCGDKIGELECSSAKVAVRKWNTVNSKKAKSAHKQESGRECITHYACDCLLKEIAGFDSYKRSVSQMLVDLHWMARRYADGRQSYATGMFNQITRSLIAMGLKLNATGDGTVWARDGAGRGCDGLTDEEASLGSAPDWMHPNTQRELEKARALLELYVKEK